MLSTEICSIFHMLRKPNSLIALLFIQNNSKFKNMAETYLPASMLNSSSIVYVEVCPVPQVFSKEQMSPPELSSCCFCHVFSYYSSCSSYSWQEWNVRHFFFTTKTTQPRPQVLSVTVPFKAQVLQVKTCNGLHFWRHFLVKHKVLPNLVISNWLWWIMRVLLANQN